MHITNDETSLYDVRNIREPVKIGDGNLVYATKVGKSRITYAKNSKEQEDFVLENVQYIPDLWVKLFSITAIMSKGCNISNEDKAIMIKKNGLRLTFDEEIKTKNGYVCGIMLGVKKQTDCCFAAIHVAHMQDINDLHKKLGHMSESMVCKMAKYYEWPIALKFITCESCALAKSCQKNTNKETKMRSMIPSKRLFIDISSVKNKSYGGLKFWLLAVDDVTDLSFSLFLKSKDQMAQAMILLIKGLRNKENIVVKKI